MNAVTECVLVSLRVSWGREKSPVPVFELDVKDSTERAPEGKARNRPSDGRHFVNSVSGQITLPPGLVRGRRFGGDGQVSPQTDKISLSPDGERVVPKGVLVEDEEKHGGSRLHRLVFELSWSGWADLTS